MPTTMPTTPKFVPIPGQILAASASHKPVVETGKFGLPAIHLHDPMAEIDVAKPFNVLYVAPSRIPIFEGICAAIVETIEFVRPVTRLGLPKTTIYNKCPYYREDGPHPVSLRSTKMRQLMDEMESGRLYEAPEVVIPRTRHLYGPVSPWIVAALNTGVFVFFSLNGSG